jgi:hypothetical protein
MSYIRTCLTHLLVDRHIQPHSNLPSLLLLFFQYTISLQLYSIHMAWGYTPATVCASSSVVFRLERKVRAVHCSGVTDMLRHDKFSMSADFIIWHYTKPRSRGTVVHRSVHVYVLTSSTCTSCLSYVRVHTCTRPVHTSPEQWILTLVLRLSIRW